MRISADPVAVARWALYKADPVQFIRDFMRVEPLPWQARVLADLAKPGAHVAVRSGHGVGKSTLAAWAVIWFLLTHYPCKIPCTAPSAHQLSDVLWAEIALWMRRLPPYLRSMLAWTSEQVQLSAAPSESFAVARTARPEKPESLQGFHSENLLFVLDEASGIEDVIFEVAQGALSTEGSRVIMLSNPTRTSGYFFNAFNRMRDRWICHHVPCSESSFVSPSYALDVAAQFGRESNAYRIRVDGDFPISDDDALIPLHLLEAAVVRDVAPVDTMMPVWGIDVARFGDDYSAMAIRVGNTMPVPTRKWHGLDTMALTGTIAALYRKTIKNEDRPSEILVDVIGIGAGVVDRLRELGLPARGINVGESATDGQFMRLRDQLWWKAREWFDERDCKIVSDDGLIADLVGVKYRTESSGKIKVEAKDETKKRIGRSPDVADAFVLTFAGGMDRKIDDRAYKNKRYGARGGTERNWRTT